MPDDLDRFRTAKVSVDGREVPVTAPYNFVPLEPFCIPTPWGDKPRLDKPHADGLCGELTITWTAEAPVLVGGAGEASAQFFRTDTGEDSIALPGSTLRGAVRALLEGVTMARMEIVDRDAKYPVGGRDKRALHTFSAGDVLQRQRKESDEQASLDFIQALFGHVPDEGGEAAPPANEPRRSAWRSRVQFSDAPAEPNSEWIVRSVSGVMGAPRPSFSPYYLVHSDEEGHPGPVDWSDPKANLAGFKRYPVRNRPAAFIAAAENQRIATTMAFVHPQGRGLAFTGRVRFHNLLPAELGALIFALQFGAQGDASLRQAIGRGKPQGYGRMRAQISKARIERNDGNPTSFDVDAAAWVQMFQAHVEDCYHRLRQPQPEQPQAFHAIPFVAATLAMQDKALGTMLEDRLVYPGVRGAQNRTEGEATLKAYVAIKKKAREKVADARLPPFPHRRK